MAARHDPKSPIASLDREAGPARLFPDNDRPRRFNAPIVPNIFVPATPDSANLRKRAIGSLSRSGLLVARAVTAIVSRKQRHFSDVGRQERF